jgi:hypothetical protein
MNYFLVSTLTEKDYRSISRMQWSHPSVAQVIGYENRSRDADSHSPLSFQQW